MSGLFLSIIETLKKTDMKQIGYLWSVMCLAVCLAFQSCGDDDGYSLGDFTAPQLATVRVVGVNGFYLDCDVWGTCWPVNTDMGEYVPVDGQRVVTVFNPLWDNYGGYDHAVKILEMQNVLTKNVEPMASEDEDKFGNEAVPTAADGITIGNGYLNVFFGGRLPFTTNVSLVYPKTDLTQTTTVGASDDGYIYLELRCNTNADTEINGTYSVVSYSLSNLTFTADTRGIKLSVNLPEVGEQELTFELVQQDGTEN